MPLSATHSSILSTAREFEQRAQGTSAETVRDALLTPICPYSTDPAQPPLPLKAENVALPSSGSPVPLDRLLPPRLFQEFATPSALGLASDPSPVKPCFLAPEKEYHSLLRRLEHKGILSVTKAPKAVNGLFCVPKSDGKLRLILDARPANALFAPPPQVKLPGPDLLTRCHAPSGTQVYAAKLDIDAYFHRILLPKSFWPYFALPAVPASVLACASHLPPDQLVHPCLCTLPMGFSYSTLIAQLVHMHILSTVLPLSDCISQESKDFSLSRFRWFAYIDDLALLCPSMAKLRNVVRRVKAAYRKFGLQSKPSKEVRPTQDPVELLGIEFDGRRCRFGLAMPKLLALVRLTNSLASSPRCTPQALSYLLGKWAWALLVCRPLFSVLHASYVFVYKATGSCPLWPSVRRELRLLCELAPFLSVSLLSPVSSTVVATDASSSGFGVVAANSLASRIRSFIDTSTGRRRDVIEQAQASSTLASTLRFYVLFSAPWSHPNHINVLEMSAISLALSRLASSPRNRGHRVLLLVDSLVCMHALQKGRSSSYSLLVHLRRIASTCLWSSISPHFVYVSTVSNPADAASRNIHLL
jgi:hypothetical protein